MSAPQDGTVVMPVIGMMLTLILMINADCIGTEQIGSKQSQCTTSLAQKVVSFFFFLAQLDFFGSLVLFLRLKNWNTSVLLPLLMIDSQVHL